MLIDNPFNNLMRINVQNRMRINKSHMCVNINHHQSHALCFFYYILLYVIYYILFPVGFAVFTGLMTK